VGQTCQRRVGCHATLVVLPWDEVTPFAERTPRAADKEDIEFELDRAELILQEAVAQALRSGEDITVVADVAELPLDDVTRLAARTVDLESGGSGVRWT